MSARRLSTQMRLALASNEAEQVIAAALKVLEMRMRYSPATCNAPGAVRDYLRILLSGKDYEVFVCILLDAQNRVICSEELFRGTLTQTSVYPREVVKYALANGAAGVIFAHNHPSGLAEPSQADKLLTRTLRQALALVDVRVMDHLIVGDGTSMSFAERGLI